MPHKEYRAVFSYPPNYLGSARTSYSRPTTDIEKLPTHSPQSDETFGWRSGTQVREVTDWEDLAKE